MFVGPCMFARFQNGAPLALEGLAGPAGLNYRCACACACICVCYCGCPPWATAFWALSGVSGETITLANLQIKCSRGTHKLGIKGIATLPIGN